MEVTKPFYGSSPTRVTVPDTVSPVPFSKLRPPSSASRPQAYATCSALVRPEAVDGALVYKRCRPLKCISNQPPSFKELQQFYDCQKYGLDCVDNDN